MDIGLSITRTFMIPNRFNLWVGLSPAVAQSGAPQHDRFQWLYKVFVAWERRKHNHARVILDAESQIVDH